MAPPPRFSTPQLAARESRQSDSPTGVGSPPEFPRGRNTTTRPPPFAPLGNAGVPSAPWENHFDVIPGAAPGRTETPTPKRLRERRLSDSATGGGGTADLPRERETTTSPHLLPPWGFLACRRPPWENHFDVIPGPIWTWGFQFRRNISLSPFFSPVFSLSVYIYIYTYMYTYTYICVRPAPAPSPDARAARP